MRDSLFRFGQPGSDDPAHAAKPNLLEFPSGIKGRDVHLVSRRRRHSPARRGGRLSERPFDVHLDNPPVRTRACDRLQIKIVFRRHAAGQWRDEHSAQRIGAGPGGFGRGGAAGGRSRVRIPFGRRFRGSGRRRRDCVQIFRQGFAFVQQNSNRIADFHLSGAFRHKKFPNHTGIDSLQIPSRPCRSRCPPSCLRARRCPLP